MAALLAYHDKRGQQRGQQRGPQRGRQRGLVRMRDIALEELAACVPA